MDLTGRTALVTGASGGLGAEFARALAARGADIVLVARSGDALRRNARDLHNRYGVRAEAVACDLTAPEAVPTLLTALAERGWAVDVLVNNAGFGSVGRFDEIAADRSRREVALNVTAVVELTQALLPRMRRQGFGAVLNVASISAYQPGPYMAVYAAAKAFVLSLSQALAAETADDGIRVLAVCPGPVDTGFFDAAGSREIAFGRMRSPEYVVRRSLAALDRGRHVVTPAPDSRILPLLARLLPRRTMVSATARSLGRALPSTGAPAAPGLVR